MPTPPTAERRHKSANLLTRYPREAVVHLPHLSSPPNIRFSLAICLLALTLLTACKPVGPNYNRPGFEAPEAYKETGASTAIVPPPNPAGGGWQKANPSDGMLRGKWWEIYQDPQLNQLEEQISPNGQPNNQQLRQAMETYLAARDQIKVARSSLYPTLSASPSASRNQVSFNEPLFNRTNNPNYNDYEITGQASWEPDFFGRIRRTIEAARETAQATAAQMAVVDLSLHAEMASDYFQLRGLDSETKLLKSTVADLEHQLDLTQRRLSGGVATDVDVAQARTQLETVRAQLIDVGVARAQSEHAIGTIANRRLTDFSIPFSPIEESLSLPQIPTGVPSQLLERRPDVANAERLTAAANAQIGIAISAYYPTITLGGTGGFQSTDLGTLFQGPSALWSLGAQATELLFDAGQRHALTDQARHTYEAQAAAYRNTIFQAFNDVEDQLSSLRILEQESTVEDRAVASAQHSFDLSNKRYKGGVTSYLEVLTSEATLIQNQRTDIDLRTRQFVSSVGLVRSLGGSWDTTQLPK
jgi:NodT family efflux transporter outer membrane factor (OMF) lipoprotein